MKSAFRPIAFALSLAASLPVSAATPEDVFSFAASNFPLIFAGAPSAGQFQQFNYRYFPGSGNYLAISTAGEVFVMGPYTGGAVVAVGTTSDLDSEVNTWLDSTSAPTRFLLNQSCHIQAQATLQKKELGLWKDVAAAQGWERIETCVSPTQSFRPYTTAKLPLGTEYRWRVYTSAWEWFSSEKKVERAWDPSVLPKAVLDAPIAAASYAMIGAMARDTIWREQPGTSRKVELIYKSENGVAQQSLTLIAEMADYFMSRFGDFLSYDSRPVGLVQYINLAEGQKITQDWNPANSYLQWDMARTFPLKTDPATHICKSDINQNFFLSAFAVGYEKFTVIGVPCATTNVHARGTVAHEMGHLVQSIVVSGANPIPSPPWMVEGQANVIADAMAGFDDKSIWATGRSNRWRRGITAVRTLDQLKALESSTTSSVDVLVRGSEYHVGAAIVEYLTARSGFAKTLQVQQISGRTLNSDKMSGFREAFLLIYGQTLDEFYAEALPYVNYLATTK